MKKFNLLPIRNDFKLLAFFYPFWLIKEIIFSSISVVKIALSRKIFISPSLGIVSSEELGNIGTILYANSITLTPGTLSVKLENNLILVHALDTDMLNDLQNGKMYKKIKNILI